MSEAIKEIENTPEKAVYQFGEGKDALTFTIKTGITTYLEETLEEGYPWPKGYHNENTDYIELKLLSNEINLYSIYRKGMEDARCVQDLPPQLRSAKKVDSKKEIAEQLYDDNSKEAVAIKKFLKDISGNELIDTLNKMIEETPQRRKAELQRVKEERLQEQQRIKAYWQREREKRDNAQNAVQQFVGEGKDTITKQKEAGEALAKSSVGINKLATLRKKIAHDIDETLGTHLEEKKLPKVLKKIEEPLSKVLDKIVSNKKVNE